MTSAERAKEKRLNLIYNQSLEEHNALRKEQLNACAICRRPFSQFQPYQDHDHACCPRRQKRYCGKCNRGLLCFLCNKKVVAFLEYFRKIGIDIHVAEKYIDDWTVKIRAKGGYEPKEKSRTKRTPVARGTKKKGAVSSLSQEN